MTQPRTKWLVLIAVLLVMAIVPFLIMSSWNSNGAHQAGPAGVPQGGPPAFAMPVEVSAVVVGPVTDAVSAVGSLEANESVMIRPEILGRVTRVNFQEGQAVEKGRILIELESGELTAQLAQAEASVEIARLNYDRMKRLIANDNVSKQELDQAATNLKSSQANYTLFQERLSKTKIRSPFSGYLGTRRVSPGDYVQAGRDIVNLEDLTTLKSSFMVPEMFFSRLAVGQQVQVRVDAFPGHIFRGEVYSIDPRVEELSRTVRVRAKIPNPDVKLRPGMFANVSLVLGHVDNALLIPEEAIVPQQDKTFVFRLDDKTARLTEVRLGARERGMVQALSGVQPQDVVVRAGHQKIRDGMPVMPVESGQ